MIELERPPRAYELDLTGVGCFNLDFDVLETSLLRFSTYFSIVFG